MPTKKPEFSKRGDAYRHVDKDPVIDIIRSLVQEAGGQKIPAAFLAKLSYDSGVSVSALNGWFFGKTKRPQNLTVKFVLEALGCRYQIVRQDGSIVKGPRSTSS